MLIAQQQLQCWEHGVFNLFRWLMSSPLQCGLQRKLSVSILSLHNHHLSSSSTLSLKLLHYNLSPVWHVQSGGALKSNAQDELQAHIWRTYVWLHQPCCKSTWHKLQFAHSTTNINISNLLFCTTVNVAGSTLRVLINHDYDAPLAAAFRRSQRINSIPVLSVGTPCMMIQVVRQLYSN